MTGDGEALFRTVCEYPADDTPRLVFADWLEENGQPERAEFIRLQCEAWNLCPAYPTDAARRTWASVLLKRHGDQWYAELPHPRGIMWSAIFVRGFVDAVTLMPARDLMPQVEAVFAAAPLRHLRIMQLEPGQLAELFACPFVGRLAALRLPGTRGDDEGRLVTDAQKRFPQIQIF